MRKVIGMWLIRNISGMLSRVNMFWCSVLFMGFLLWVMVVVFVVESIMMSLKSVSSRVVDVISRNLVDIGVNWCLSEI